MGTIEKRYTFTAGTPGKASEVNYNYDQLFDLINGNLDNNNVKSGAAIAGTKVDLSTNSTFLVEHDSTGAHSGTFAGNRVDNCRIYAGATPASQISVKFDAMELFTTDAPSTRAKFVYSDTTTTSITNRDITSHIEDGSAEANTTWYYIWVAIKSDGTTPTAFYSTSNTIAGLTLAGDYATYASGFFRCIGRIHNDANGNLQTAYPAAGVCATRNTTDQGQFQPVLEGDYDVTGDGYLRLGNGWMIQFGTTAAVDPGDNDVITFPIEFPTACLIVMLTDTASATYNNYVSAKATANFTISRDALASASVASYWLAIGY